MISQKIINFTKSFENKFKDFLIEPESNFTQSHEKDRLVIVNKSIILLAQQKLSDWDVYYYVNKDKINVDVLNEMREFISNWTDFDLIKDYITDNPLHINAGAYQSIENIFWVQFMGMIKDESFAPFIDIHIIGTDKNTLIDFYSPISKMNGTGYLDWSILTLWRKFCKSGEIDKNGEMFSRSIYPALSSEQAKEINLDLISFFKTYFKDKSEFKKAYDFLNL